MSKIIFTAGAKGGTGKSTAARFLITYLREQGENPLLMDMDDENRTLSRFFPEAIRIEIRKKSSHDILVERALDDSRLIIADLKAGNGREVLDWWLDVSFDELKSRAVAFVCLASVTRSGSASAGLFHHGGAQDFINAGLISLSLGFKPCKDVSINSECERLLDGAIEFANYRAGPVAYFRKVRQVNVFLLHFL